MNEYPTKCNICSGEVVYVSNAKVYGKQYGSGYCYYCTNCGAYVGTHEPSPKKAYGLLADKEMREWKIKCHSVFDSKWKTRKGRSYLYKKLASQMHIPVNECHFGHFDLGQLKKAYQILQTWEGGSYGERKK